MTRKPVVGRLCAHYRNAWLASYRVGPHVVQFCVYCCPDALRAGFGVETTPPVVELPIERKTRRKRPLSVSQMRKEIAVIAKFREVVRS